MHCSSQVDDSSDIAEVVFSDIFTADMESKIKEGLVGFLWLSGFPGRWDEESKSKHQLFPGRR